MPPARLVFTITDQPDDDAEVVIVELTEVAGQTEMVFQQRGGHLSDEEYGRAQAGWGGFFDALSQTLSNVISGDKP